MPLFKALISRKGDILSLVEETATGNEPPPLHIAAECRYPDTVFVKADDKAAAEDQVRSILDQCTPEEEGTA